MRLNESLNLVVPVFGDDGETVAGYVHSTPLARITFDAYYRLVAATFATILSDGLDERVGPRVAALVLRDVAAARKIDPEPLLNEIKRLSYFIRPGDGGWETLPLHDAAQRGLVGEEDMADVMNFLVFFIVASAMLPRQTAKVVLPGVAAAWGAETSSLLPTAWVSSLRTSTATVSSGATEPSPSPTPQAVSDPAPAVRFRLAGTSA